MTLLRVFGAVFGLALRRAAAFRADLVFQLVTATVGALAGLVALGLVYTQTTTLGGWSRGEAIVLLGTYQIVSGLLATFVEPNLQWFGSQVYSGKLDEVLLKPIAGLFLISLGSPAPLGLVGVVTGILVVGAGVVERGALPPVTSIGAWVVLIGVALVVSWASRVLVALVVLWAPGADVDVVYGAVWQFGRYPVTIYGPALRFVLTWVVPVAFVAAAPAAALTRGVSPSVLLGGVGVSLGGVMAVRIMWTAGLRRYTSATS